MSNADARVPRVILVIVKVLLRAVFLSLLAGPVSPGQSSLMGIASEELERNFRILKEKSRPAAVLPGLRDHGKRIQPDRRNVGRDYFEWQWEEPRAGHLGPRRHSQSWTTIIASAASAPNSLPAPRSRSTTAPQPYSGASGSKPIAPTARRPSGSSRYAPIRKSMSPPRIRRTISPKSSRRFIRNCHPALRFDAADWTKRVRQLSLAFKAHTAILTSSVSVAAQRECRYFVNTEGARVEHGRGFARVIIVAHGRAADGMNLTTAAFFDALDAASLPADDVLLAAVEQVAKDLEGLLEAPVVEPFLGPAIFSGRAAGVFFHEIFGHRIEGHRQKDEAEGQTFTRSVGSPVLPDFLSVIFDPTRRKVGGVDLNGWYTFDDEGMPGSALRRSKTAF